MATKKTKNPALLNRRPTWKKDELYVLWAKCAGRCEICNKILFENNYTLDRVKHGQLAHIIAHSEDPKAPRGIKEFQKNTKIAIS